VPEILSQQEIDSLLSGIPLEPAVPAAAGEEERPAEREAVTFDFRLPHRLSKNQLRTLQAVHESFAEALSSYLISRLQTNVTINVSSVDQLFYSEYVLSVPSPSCLFIFRVVESDALAVLEFSPQLVLGIVARLLGGASEGDKKPRLITRIEQNIIRGITQRAIADLQKSWKTIADLNFKFERYESEGDFAQIAPTSEIVLVVSFEVSIAEQKYLMNLCFPTFALEEVLAKLNVQHFSGMPSGHGENSWTRELMKKIGQTSVETVGVLGTTTLSLSELVGLREGDVLRTSIPVHSEVQLLAGGRPRFMGRAGMSNGRLAIKITRSALEPARTDPASGSNGH
jgi:flagellar motor switch protein FliM